MKRSRKNFKARKKHLSFQKRVDDLKSEDLIKYIHRAEKEAIPVIKDLKPSAGAAIFLLAQYVQVLITGNSLLTSESSMNITNKVIEIWGTGSYQPAPEYPFTLEETRRDIQGGFQSKGNYAEYFQPFIPIHNDTPIGIGQVAGGIVLHPKTRLWQIWMILDGPCEYLGAYRDPIVAQRNLEEFIKAARKGGNLKAAQSLYEKLLSQADDEPQQITFDMMLYLTEHLSLYLIKL